MSKFKHLGVTLLCNINDMKKIIKAKIAISSTWKGFSRKRFLLPSYKFRLFEAAVRPIMSHASLTWRIF